MPELAETNGYDSSLPPALAEGLALALRVKDGDSGAPLLDWLARHPHWAEKAAAFLADERDVIGALPPVAGAVGGLQGLQLGEVLGEGGMGVVHRAYDPKLKRDVAVKLVLPGTDLARFRFEAESVASLDDPNVVRVYDLGEANGRPYLVMEIMEGGSLAQLLARSGPDRRLPPRQAAEIVRDIARGAHHAHQRGLIHRDLKPGNVLLTDDGRPKIADFGLARRLEAGPGHTQTGAIVGTLPYMAREQARGEKVLTTGVDIHALGAILYELLAGEPPFGRGDDYASTIHRIVEEPAPPLRARRKDAPPDLEEVCRRCLAKDPRDRYPSAQELADDLTRYLNGEPIGRRTGGRFSAILRGLVSRRETAEMVSWHVPVWGAASGVAAMAALQASVLLDAPAWVSWAVMAYFLVAWAGILWVFLISQWDRLNSVERGTTLTHLGLKVACAACLPAYAWPDGDVVRALPAFLAVTGMGIFDDGHRYWGRLYLVGLMYFALAALMPLLPQLVWPTVFGLWSGGVQLWAARHLWRVHREAACTSAR